MKSFKQQMQDEFAAGRSARMAGKSRNSNPWMVGFDRWKAWACGWQAEAEAWLDEMAQ